jgi:gliding motility-associated protein GldM
MVDKGEGKKLYSMLDDYKKKVLAVDPKIASDAATSVQIDLTMPPTKNKGNNTWEAAYFRMVPTVAAMTILSKFQNDVKTTENKLVAFCHEQVGKVEIVFDAYSAIVGQSTNYVMPGEEFTVTAGVGAYSKDAKPVININGTTVPMGTEGFAEQKIRAGALGTHKIPVQITYFNQITGKEEVAKREIEYTVAQANASIALDEMNVLYIGYDNKVTIATSGAGDERVSASISGGGGALQKLGGGKYIAKVSSVTDECIINVSVDGKPSGSSRFRVRTIPMPTATIGGVASQENMNAGQLRAQQGVGAYIKDFPLALKYTVTGFTIVMETDDGDLEEAVCTGNTWSPKAANMIKNAKAGKTLSVENIRAQGPDGRSQKLPGLTYYIK